MNPRGRRAAIAVTWLGIATVVGSVVALREKALEQWYVWRLDSKDFVVKYRAAIGLGKLGSRKAIPELITLLKQSYGHDREALLACSAGPADIPATELMVTVFLGVGRPAVPALAQALREETPLSVDQSFWRVRACRSLGSIKAKESVSLLADLLEDKDCRVRLAACQALAAIGPDAKDAVPALTKVLSAKIGLSAPAATALKEIQGSSSVSAPPGRPREVPDGLKTSEHGESAR